MKTPNSNLETQNSKLATPSFPLPSSLFYLLLALGALLYLPTRLIQEANPDWRLVSWALALEVIGITLCIASLFHQVGTRSTASLSSPENQGRGGTLPYQDVPIEGAADVSVSASRFPLSAFRFSNLAFPVCFFLVAVPWPTLVEGPLIQALTRAVSNLTVETLGLLGVPAMQHGNVIELSTGVLGIDEACSGIRSFQATLMISLFLGEVYRLSLRRRFAFCLAGFAVAFCFNVGRTLVLTLVAVRKGIPAVATWHDPAGVTILVGCFVTLWFIGVLLAKRKSEGGGQKVEVQGGAAIPNSELRTPNSELRIGNPDLRPPTSSLRFPLSAFRFVSISFCLWIVAVELSVNGWYRSHEAKLPRAIQWTVQWPTNSPGFAETAIPARTRQILRYDEGRNVTWTDEGHRWQGIFLRWKPGRTALYLARNHTPEICLPAAGRTLLSSSDLQWFDIRGLRLPFRAYELSEGGQSLRVYYCLWDDRSNEQGFETSGLNFRNRLAPVWVGRRNAGQRSLEIAVREIADDGMAKAAVKAQLEKLIIRES